VVFSLRGFALRHRKDHGQTTTPWSSRTDFAIETPVPGYETRAFNSDQFSRILKGTNLVGYWRLFGLVAFSLSNE
jgi:hypothetical protein